MKYLLYIFMLWVIVNPLAAREILVSGSTTIQPVLEEIAKAYMKENPDVRVSIQGGGSGSGIQALIDKKTDIAMSSRFIRDDELNKAREKTVYPVPFHIAYDAIIPVVNTKNKISNLSLEQVQKIYLGEIADWQVLGTDKNAIRVICRGAKSGTHDVWNKLVLRGKSNKSCSESLSSSLNVVQAIQANKGAIGYVGLAYLSASSRVKPLRVNKVMGSSKCVKKGCYSLSRTLFLLTDGWPDNDVMNFINYVLDPEHGQKIIKQSGLTPLH